MDFDKMFIDEREKGETQIRKCQLVALRMLKIFDFLCTKHNITYFLVAGSLLGAVRHKGFIPWDDDIDVGMTRENYEKFILYAVPELPKDIFFQNCDTDAHYPPYCVVEARLRDRYSSYTRSEKHKKIVKWHDGIMIDLCVFDKAFLPNNYLIFILNRCIKFFGQTNSFNKRSKFLKFVAKYTPFSLVYASNFVSNRKSIKKGTNYLKEEEILALVRVGFEDMEVLIPQGYHNYLKRRWGNYTELPPLEKQRGHHGIQLPDPFTPCNHSEILYWKDSKTNNRY